MDAPAFCDEMRNCTPPIETMLACKKKEKEKAGVQF